MMSRNSYGPESKRISPYGKEFYAGRDKETRFAANRILTLVKRVLPSMASVVDLGCGTGTWLSQAEKLGAEKVCGMDGDWVDRDSLVIPEECFQVADFEESIVPNGRFDLAISLEVAEHISPESASKFVETLTRFSDFVLFSAAIPFQGGVGHLNENWPSYWKALFGERGFQAVDCIRPEIWDDADIPIWYRQNAMLFVAREANGQLSSMDVGANWNGASLVHPSFYLDRISRMHSVKTSWTVFCECLLAWLRKRISF